MFKSIYLRGENVSMTIENDRTPSANTRERPSSDANAVTSYSHHNSRYAQDYNNNR